MVVIQPHLRVSIDAYYLQMTAVHKAGDIAERAQRVRVGPMQVVKDQDEGLLPGQVQQQPGERFVKAKAFLVLAQGCRRWRVGQEDAHVRDELGQGRGIWAETTVAQ